MRRLLKLYPASFREQFGAQIEGDFAQMVADLGRFRAWGRLLGDLALSIPRERRSAGYPPIWPLALGLAVAVPLGYLDFHAKEVQGIVAVILVLSVGFSAVWPRRAWAWLLLFGGSVPAWHLTNSALGHPSPIPSNQERMPVFWHSCPPSSEPPPGRAFAWHPGPRNRIHQKLSRFDDSCRIICVDDDCRRIKRWMLRSFREKRWALPWGTPVLAARSRRSPRRCSGGIPRLSAVGCGVSAF